jgi:antitoxin VapB
MKMLTAKVFTSGNSQAVRLPKQFRLETTEIFIYKEGNQLILTPKMTSWDGFIAGFSGLSDDFSTEDNLPADIPRRAFE